MRFQVYDKSVDNRGNVILTKRGEFETWRETHGVRRLQKNQRTVDNVPITSIVYDATGQFLCSP